VSRQFGCAVQCTNLEGCMQLAFSEADFTFPEFISLNRMVVPTFCAATLHSH